MSFSKSTFLGAALGLGLSQFAQDSNAGLFKIDFGHLQNEAPILEYEIDYFDGEVFGGPEEIDSQPAEPLTDWDVIPTFTFADPNAEVTEGSASLMGEANEAGTEVTWSLRDFSESGSDSDVTMTILDNTALPPAMLGMTANNPTHEGFKYVDFDGNAIPLPQYQHVPEIIYDGVLVPFVVKDDYLYRNPDNAGTESLMRFGNLDPGFYKVTVFEGRTTDGNGRFGKVWAGDINGSNAPDEQNTGNYAGVYDSGEIAPQGQPRSVVVEVKAGEYLWFAEMEDNSGGISGMIVRSVDFPPPPADVATSPGLFKIDFGHHENDKEGVEALSDWNVIPTWTFSDPNSDVAEGSSSLEGTANAAQTEVTWALTDFSNDKNANVTMTIMDNAALTAATGQPPALGQISNNPTLEKYEGHYDGVFIPAIVKNDYNYRNPDTAGSELLMRFVGLKPGTYNVTVFEGRTTDGDGRFGKVWVDDMSGGNAPAEQNTGNYAGMVNPGSGAVIAPAGNPQTVTVNLGEGQHLWFAEMEDNSGGISGLIIRGVSGGSTGGGDPEPGGGPANVAISASTDKVTLSWEGTGALQKADAVTGPWSNVAEATSPYEAAATGAAAFFRVR